MWLNSFRSVMLDKATTNEKTTITVVVSSGKGLRTTSGKHKFAVTCEVGSQKCRTVVMEDLFGNPTFNETFNFSVDQPVDEQSLGFLVTEKKEKRILGQVTIPLRELPIRQSQKDASNTSERISDQVELRRVALQTHKSCQSPIGELVYDAWLTMPAVKTIYRPLSLPMSIDSPLRENQESENFSSLTSRSSGSLKKFRDRLARSIGSHNSSTESNESTSQNSLSFSRRHSMFASLMSLKSDRSSRSSSFSSSVAPEVTNSIPVDKLSLQQAAILSHGDEDNFNNTFDDECSLRFGRNRAARLSLNSDDLETGYRKRWSLEESASNGGSTKSNPPIISSVSPSNGPTAGGTTIVIFGHHLGISRDDIVTLSVCGCDVLASLEYVSAERLICKTESYRPCVGLVVVETASGGRSGGTLSSSAQFTFTDDRLDISDPSSNEIVDYYRKDISPSTLSFESTLNVKRLKKMPVDDGDVDLPPKPRQRSVSVPSVAIPRFLSTSRQLNRDDDVIDNWQSPILVRDLEGQSSDSDLSGKVVFDVDIEERAEEAVIRKVHGLSSTRTSQPQQLSRPPIVEILPIRMGDDRTLRINEDSKAPRKPLRHFVQPPDRITEMEQEKLRMTDKELITIADLEAQLTANQNEITKLADQNKSLKEQYDNLHFYVDLLLVRVIESCPQLLAVDLQWQ